MKYELTPETKHFLALSGGERLLDIISPLKQEIHLFDTYIAGLLSLPDPAVAGQIRPGDSLQLKREECLYDEFRINVVTSDGKKAGSIPEKDNVVFARLLDAGKQLTARVKDVNVIYDSPVISISIYLTDF